MRAVVAVLVLVSVLWSSDSTASAAASPWTSGRLVVALNAVPGAAPITAEQLPAVLGMVCPWRAEHGAAAESWLTSSARGYPELTRMEVDGLHVVDASRRCK